MQLFEIEPSEAAELIGVSLYGFDPIKTTSAHWFTDGVHIIVAGVIQQDSLWRYAIMKRGKDGLRWLGGECGFNSPEAARLAMEAKLGELGLR